MFPADDHPPLPDPGQVTAAEREARLLRRDFPRYRIDLSYTPMGPRYSAQRKEPGPGLYAVVTGDPIELRSELSGEAASLSDELRRAAKGPRPKPVDCSRGCSS